MKLSTSKGPEVTVVIVTYDSESVVERFLESLPAAMGGIRYEIVVVDNASSDRTASIVQRYPGVRVVLRPDNGGYAAGINAGLLCMGPSSHAVLVCNPDVVLCPGVGRGLLAALEEPAVGIAVPRHVDEAGSLVRSLRRRPTLLRALGEALVGGNRAGRSARFGEVIQLAEDYEHPSDVDWASGAVMLLSRKCLDAVGPWDERFFLYSEETDYALRAGDAGFRIRYVPEAVVVHEGGDLHRSPSLWRLQVVNRVRLYRQRHGLLASAAYWFAVLLNESIRATLGRSHHRAAVAAPFRPGSVRSAL